MSTISTILSENFNSCRLRASQQSGEYPRPQLMRDSWHDLSGIWQFTYDDGNIGLDRHWYQTWPEDKNMTIQVPFPPESSLSGIRDRNYHRIVWYRFDIPESIISNLTHARNHGDRIRLNFGAIDYLADIWVNGLHVAQHEGGHTPFSCDITAELFTDSCNTIVVRAEDDPLNVSQPRGKQDWMPEPHVIWYPRTTGIWQPVWIETVPPLHVQNLHWVGDIVSGTVSAAIILSERPAEPVNIEVELLLNDTTIAKSHILTREQECRIIIPLDPMINGQAEEELYWSPEHPTLIDATVSISGRHVHSYFGMRNASTGGGAFLLNDRPFYLRSVLEQGYWAESLLAAPSADALHDEVETILSLGFNAVRVHQKFSDPRFLYWADRLGLLVWGEAPAAYAFTPKAVERTVHEWMEVIARDFSHPSIVTWVPLNESWGVQHIALNMQQQWFSRALSALTKALDPTRPVIGNDGWEQVDSDMLTIHDYNNDAKLWATRYSDRNSVMDMASTAGPAGRQLVVKCLDGSMNTTLQGNVPIMLTEFGGISFCPHTDSEEWGYTNARSEAEFEQQLRSLFNVIRNSKALSGFCYTQLTDTFQEANGLLHADRTPKLPLETLRSIVTGK